MGDNVAVGPRSNKLDPAVGLLDLVLISAKSTVREDFEIGTALRVQSPTERGTKPMATTGGEHQRFGSIFEGGSAVGLSPTQLLSRFAESRDEAAFSALVAHHGPMVLATCRRILANPADADDAFQATFLVLAKKAKAIGDPDRLAPWLHGVARRVAVRSRSLTARRKEVETEGQGAVAVAPPPDDAQELRSVLDEELARLPEKYRAPLVLCYLEGLTHDEAAEQLTWPVGTVRSRMAQARDRLRTRLARRGYAPGALAVLSPSALPTVVVSRSLQALTVRLVFTTSKTAATSAAVLLAQGALTSMFMTKVQTIAIATLAVATTLAAGTAGVVAQQESAPVATPTPNPAPTPNPTGSTEEEQPSSVDPAQPTRGSVDLAKELDAAKARIKALEAELAALKAPGPSMRVGMMGGMMGRGRSSALPPLPPVPNVPDQPEAPPSPPAPPTSAFATPPSPPAPPTSRPAAGAPEGATPPSTPPLSEAQKAAYSGPWTTPLSGGRVLYSPAERDRVTIIDSQSGTASTFKDPGNIKKIVPLMSNNMVGLELEGPNVTEVVALNPVVNAWLRQKLREPLIDGRVSPVVTQGMLYYGVGRSIYALGSQTHRWGVLDLKQPLSPDKLQLKVMMTNDSIIVPEDDMIHVFNPKTGDWTHLNTKEDK